MKEVSKYFKPSIVALKPYSSARDEHEGNAKIFLDANENPHDFDFNRYPDPYQNELKDAIGQWREIDPQKIFLGNGSDEIIDLLIKSTCIAGRDRILTLDPSYGMYTVSAAINEIPLDLVELNQDMTVNQKVLFETLNEDHKLIFICSPNNPNGGIINVSLIEFVLEKSNRLVVVDEAYIDFSDTSSWIRRLDEYKNLIVLQTFSKSLGAAGIRLGMAFMNEDIIYYLNKIKPPYNISSPSQEAALARLKDIKEVEKSIELIKVQRTFLKTSFETMDIIDFVYPSSSNFLLVRFYEARIVFDALKSKGIIVRDRSQQKHCKGCLRMSVGTEHENIELLKALSLINDQLKSRK